MVAPPNSYVCPPAPPARSEGHTLSIPSEGSAFKPTEQSPYRPTTQAAACALPMEGAEQALDLRVQDLEEETFV